MHLEMTQQHWSTFHALVLWCTLQETSFMGVEKINTRSFERNRNDFERN